MTRNQKMYLLLVIGILVAFIGVLSLYWVLIDFNPFVWCKNHISTFIVIGTFIIVGIFMFLGYWLQNKKRI